MTKLPAAKPSPRIAGGVLRWYAGDTFSVTLALELRDQDGEAVAVGASDSLTVRFFDEAHAPVHTFQFDSVTDGQAKLTFDDTVSAKFPKGAYFYAMNSTSTNGGGWKECAMRKTHLPTVLALMPAEVQSGIREVNKLTSAGNKSSTINTTADKLFLLSEIEIFGSISYSKSGEGTQYDYYKAGNSKVKNRNGSATSWLERSPNANNSTYFCMVRSNGFATSDLASHAYGVAFGFCF